MDRVKEQHLDIELGNELHLTEILLLYS